MRAYRTAVSVSTALAVTLTLSGCNEALVPDFNNLTGFPHSVGALQNEFTGAFNRVRDDVGFFTLATDGFARSAAYYTPSEERFVTQLTGSQPLDNDNFGAGVWDFEFNAVEVADTVISIIPQLRVNGNPVPTATQQALTGVLETIKAMDYMYVAISHDTNGVAINAVGKPVTGTLAPILCNKDTWKQIIAMLDSAKADLDAAGPGTPLAIAGSKFSLTMPPGYAALGSTAGGFEALTLALRGRAKIEYAYAIARQAGGTSVPSVSSAGAPDQAQLTGAIADIQASAVYSPTLSAAAANPANDLGVFHSFSGASGDVANPTFGNAASIFVLEGAAQQIDTVNDLRFTTKFAATQPPTSAGAAVASTYAFNLNNINISSPIPIVRNVELNFLLARAYLGTNQLLLAAQTVDAVRTTVGGLPSGLAGVNTSSYTSVRDFLMTEMRPSLMMDGTGDQIAAIRDYGLIMQDLTTWGSTDQHTSMENIPIVERQQRNNHFAPVCTS
jgi:hypothetical protein